MKRSLAIIIVILSSILAVSYWGSPECFGWIVAVTGWIDKCFSEE